MKISRIAMAIALLFLSASQGGGQDFAVKTNLLYDATATVNAGVEVGLAPKWTLDLSGDINAWNLKDGQTWKHMFVQPEVRYWFCDRFAGWFLGLHTHGGIYNLGGVDIPYDFPVDVKLTELKDNRHEGWFIGAGIGIGYDWVLSKHWNIEFELGGGYAYTRYDAYTCEECDNKIGEDYDRNYFGPTKAEVGIVYLF